MPDFVFDFVVRGASAMTASAVVHPIELVKTRMQIAAVAVPKEDPSGKTSRSTHPGVHGAGSNSTPVGPRGATAALKSKSASTATGAVVRPTAASLTTSIGSPGVQKLVSDKKKHLLTRNTSTLLVNTRSAATPSRETLAGAVKLVFEKEGLVGFYSGLGASLLRQATYGSTRLYAYDCFSNWLAFSSSTSTPKVSSSTEKKKISVPLAAVAAVGAAGCGVAVGNPFDVALVRLQVDSMRPLESQLRYQGVVDALRRICAEEGWRTLWSGAGPNLARACAMNVGQLATFDVAKNWFQERLSGSSINPAYPASLLAGVACATLSLPFDFAKSQLQSKGSGFTSVADVLVGTTREHGIGRLWRGWFPYVCRCSPHAMITLLLIEAWKGELKK